MADHVEFNLRREGLRELLKSAEVQHDLNRRADQVAARTRETAPYDDSDEIHYRDHVETREHPTPNRARAEVVATVPYAFFVELHHRTLGKALDAAREL